MFNIARVSTGLDLGANSIKIVQLRKTKEKISLIRFAIGALPSEDSKIAEAIKGLLREKKIRPGKVRCLFSKADTILKEVKLPALSEEELKKAIVWQAEKHLSFSIEEAVVDYQIMGNSLKTDTEFNGLLIISKKKEIENEVYRLGSVGFTPTLVDIVPFALVKSYQSNYEFPPRQMVAIIETGAKLTWLVVVNSRGLKLVRVLTINPAMLDDFVKEMERSLSYCESKYFGEKVVKIILSGEGAGLSGFSKSLSERLEIEVEIANPFKKIEIIPGQEKIKDLSPLFMTSVGLAL